MLMFALSEVGAAEPAVTLTFEDDEALVVVTRPPIQLAPGRTVGTFHVRYEGHVGWVGTPEWPVTVTLGTVFETVASTVVTTEAPFMLEADLPAGTWTLLSRVGPDADADWWTATGPVLQVDAGGRVRCASNCSREHQLHERKMRIVAPSMNEKVDEPRPTLRWEPVDGAVGYSVRWFELRDGDRAMMHTVQNIPVNATSWQFPEAVVAERVYQWDVEARDARGTRFAHTSGYFLTPGATGRRSKSYLGFALRDDRRGHVVVEAVAPGSPAAVAGLQAADLILRFQGMPVETEEALRTAIAAVAPGTAVSVRIRRPDGTEATVHPLVGERP